MRLVPDTNVVVAALRSPAGASADLLRILDQGRGTLLLSVPLALEYEVVCQLAEHRMAAGLSENQVEIFVNGIIAMVVPVKVYFRWRPFLRDAGDEMVLETAVNGRAEALVTFNGRNYGQAPNSFGIKTLLPGEALERMKM